MKLPAHVDVLVIGAGPAGAVAAAILARKGYSVLVLEREQFPRFSIGESLLPQCMVYLGQAGMLDVVEAAGFQTKNGAAFAYKDARIQFDFAEKFTSGPTTTFQVQRARFDQLLADEAASAGAMVVYRHEITAVDLDGKQPRVTCRSPEGESLDLTAKFLLDASGFGRVLPRLLDLELPSRFPVRQSCFTHVRDGITAPDFDRNKILITIHPEQRDVWYWTIPFSNGTCSIGVVGRREFFADYPEDPDQRLLSVIREDPGLASLLREAEILQPVRQVVGYSASVKTLHGPGFALLGNAGEFLDPVFSSGVTIAMKSATLAAEVLDRQFKGLETDWEADFAVPLKRGIDTFRAFVTGWYELYFQDVIFHRVQPPKLKAMICSVLAGYAWDAENPYVRDSDRRLKALASFCADDSGGYNFS